MLVQSQPLGTLGWMEASRITCLVQKPRPISKGDIEAVTVAWSICTAFRGSFSRHSYKSQLCCRKGKVLFHCCDINAGHINNFLLSVQCPVKIQPELRILQSECRSSEQPFLCRRGWDWDERGACQGGERGGWVFFQFQLGSACNVWLNFLSN